jgi:predicted PurR-regulated permease PerM
MTKQTYKIEISPKTIIFAVLTVLALWVFYQIRSIAILFFISFILATAVNPLAAAATRKKIPVMVPMMLVYLIVILTLSLVVASLIPAVIEQSSALFESVPTYFTALESTFNLDIAGNLGSNYLNTAPTNLLKFAGGLFSNIINIFAVFFITYYIIIERPHLHHHLTGLFGKGNNEKKAEALVRAIEKVVGGWVRGELILMVIIGFMTYFSLIILGIPYALPLAVLAGILEIVPNLGPTIAAIPAIFMGLTVSPVVGLGALATSILIQQLENNLIVPKVMQSATGAQPLATILVLLMGLTLGGVMGAILAMPLYLTGLTIYKHLKK